jgi:pSer/pThr/pTyr-binding forkhead associated (FHA) protein
LSEGEQPTQGNPIAGGSSPRLFLTLHPGTDHESQIRCRRVVTLLGSRKGCKIHLQHRRVSPVHVAIVNDGSQVIAVDLVTAQGTLLNDLKMVHEHLGGGDLLSIPPWQFRVDLKDSSDATNPGLHAIELEIAPSAVALEHVDTGRLLQPNRDVCVIGRQAGCDIVIDDTSVSRAHALLLTYSGHPAIFDLLSRNKTFVNDAPVQFRLISNGDTVTIGESVFRVRVAGASVAAPAPTNKKAADGTVALTPEQAKSDMIDIHATEASQRWRIADKMGKAARKP